MAISITDRAVRALYVQSMEAPLATNWAERISSPVMTTNFHSEDYAGLGQSDNFQELKGEKKFSTLREIDWTINNVEYQKGIQIPGKWLYDDRTMLVEQRIREFFTRTRSHWLNLVMPLIRDGESSLCYDGQFFFDTDHSEGDSGTQDNDITSDISALPIVTPGTTTAPSAATLIHSAMAGIRQILAFKDDAGEYKNEHLREFIVFVPPTWFTPATQATSQTAIDGGDSNVLIDQTSYGITFVPDNRLSSWTTKMAVVAVDGGLSSAIMRQQYVPQSNNDRDADGIKIYTIGGDVNSEYFILNGHALVGAETERAAAYGDWSKACLVTLV